MSKHAVMPPACVKLNDSLNICKKRCIFLNQNENALAVLYGIIGEKNSRVCCFHVNFKVRTKFNSFKIYQNRSRKKDEHCNFKFESTTSVFQIM